MRLHAEPAAASFHSVLSPSSFYDEDAENEGFSVSISVIQQARIQAQVLVPLVKALQAELGEERANALVRKTLGDIYRRYGEEYWRTRQENNLGKAMASAFATFAREDALDYEVIEQSPDAFAIDVTGCRYAGFYQELGEPELGFLLVCAADFPMAEGFGPDIKLTRTQTIMQGAGHCDFRYRRVRETD
jgi:L-2-amino-thiazoline-4-carboxylic acid hydrolase